MIDKKILHNYVETLFQYDSGIKVRSMKVVGFNGSQREDGNTAIIMGIVFEELEEQGIETELIRHESIAPCRGCFACRNSLNCVFETNMFCEYFDKLKEADGVLLGSPVYSADVSFTMKAFLERAGAVTAMTPGLLKYKASASVAACL